MAEKITAMSSVVIAAEPPAVWAVLTDPGLLGRAFFDTRVETDWQVGSPIIFSGEWEGRSFQDKGEILTVEPNRTLRFTHFSPLTGQPDVPENYHTITFELLPRAGGTDLTISQTNVSTDEERKHTEANWAQVLGGIKQLVER